MTMEEKIEELFELVGDGDLYRYDASEKVVMLANEFAIGFAEWLIKRQTNYFESLKELLEIYKKEKQL